MTEILKKLILDTMTENKISKAELARRLGVSRPAVTQMFQDEDWTVTRLQRTVEAVGCTLHIRLASPVTAIIETLQPSGLRLVQ